MPCDPALATASNLEPNYRPAVISYLDILGFRNIVKSRSPSEVYEIIRIVRNFASSHDDESEVSECTRSFNFSDCVIRVTHFDVDFNLGALFNEILSLAHAQLELIAQGVIVRGGITVGDIVACGDTIFGPGFIRAYELESNIADFPRIVIGEEAFSALCNDCRLRFDDNSFEDELSNIDSLISIESDNVYFINYLKACFNEMDNPDLYPDYLERHKRLIVDGSLGCQGAPKILQKYYWLAKYHNSVCNSYGLTRHIITDTEICGLDDWCRERSNLGSTES